MPPDQNDLDLSMPPPEHRAAFEAMRRQFDVLAAANKRQESLIKELRHALHGEKSEKLTEDERQLAFDDLTIAIEECEAASEDARATRTTSRKKRAPVNRNLGNPPEGLPRIEEIVEPASTERPCGCGQMRKIGKDRTGRLDIIPAQLRVIVTIRPKYACRSCTDGVTQAAARPWLIESALPTEGALAHVTVAKHADHCPLYRQAQILARSGIHLDLSTLTGWVGEVAFHLGLVVDRLAENLKQSTKLFMDETTAPVLDPGGKNPKTESLWALARDNRRWGGADPPGVIYFYAPGRGGEHAEEFLKGFDGIPQIDFYPGYNRSTRPSRTGGDPINVANCWAHARRKLREVFDRDGSEIAAEGLRGIAEFYEIEHEIRSTSPGQRLSACKARTALLTEDFRTWLAAFAPACPPNPVSVRNADTFIITGTACRHS